jgi:hypothetical protein
MMIEGVRINGPRRFGTFPEPYTLSVAPRTAFRKVNLSAIAVVGNKQRDWILNVCVVS